MDIQTQDIIDEMQQRFPTEWTVCLQAAQIKALTQVNSDIAEGYQELEQRCAAAEDLLAKMEQEAAAASILAAQEQVSPTVIPFQSESSDEVIDAESVDVYDLDPLV